MPYAIELHFDDQSSAPIIALAERVYSACGGAPLAGTGWRPHISLTVFAEMPYMVDSPTTEARTMKTVPPQLDQWLVTFGPQIRDLPITLAAVGLFPGDEGVLFLAPIVTDRLLSIHRTLHENLAALRVVSRSYYRPGQWVPHCTVGFHLASTVIGAAATIARSHPLPHAVTVSALRLIAVEAPATGTQPWRPTVTTLGEY